MVRNRDSLCCSLENANKKHYKSTTPIKFYVKIKNKIMRERQIGVVDVKEAIMISSKESKCTMMEHPFVIG